MSSLEQQIAHGNQSGNVLRIQSQAVFQVFGSLFKFISLEVNHT